MAVTQPVTAPLAHLETGPCKSASQLHVWVNRRQTIQCVNCHIGYITWATDEMRALKKAILAVNQRALRKDRTLMRIAASANQCREFGMTQREYNMTLWKIETEVENALD